MGFRGKKQDTQGHLMGKTIGKTMLSIEDFP
jgi:hypothetical protein